MLFAEKAHELPRDAGAPRGFFGSILPAARVYCPQKEQRGREGDD